MNPNPEYMLAVGTDGQERLKILNELFSATSQQLLIDAGLKKDLIVLEIGCGTGNMTHWLAQQVGEGGHVYAVDISHEQLAIAQALADKNNIKNITFIESSLYDLKSLPQQIDLIYGRFILMHLKRSYDALVQLKTFLNPNGTMVFEEATNKVYCCYPPAPAFQKLRELLLQLSDSKGLDYNFGEKLYGYLRQLGLKNISANFIQPIYKNSYEKLLITLVAKEMAPQFIDAKIITADEMQNLMQELDRFIEDDSYMVSFPRVTQIFGKM